jgi:hypothetical protein
MKLWAEPEDYQDVKSFHTDSSFFLLLPSQKPSGDIFTQIAKITVTPNLATAKVAFLSMAEYDVDKINYFDSKNNLIYYTAAAPNPTQKHLYVASANPVHFSLPKTLFYLFYIILEYNWTISLCYL